MYADAHGFLNADESGAPTLPGWHTYGPIPGAGPKVPDELYLRQLMDLDLNSPEAIAHFVSEYGEMSGTDWSDFLPTEWLEFTCRPEDFNRFIERGRPLLTEVRERTKERNLESSESVSHTDEFRIRAWLLRDMTRMWLAYRGHLSEENVIARWESSWAYEPSSLEEGFKEFLVPVLNRGLAPFHFRMELDIEKRTVPLYNVLCLQLASDIARMTDYKKCANETCSRFFTRQIGGAAFSPHTDTKRVYYCSPSCATAQTQRTYRRRKRARELHAQGLTAEQIATAVGVDVGLVRKWIPPAEDA